MENNKKCWDGNGIGVTRPKPALLLTLVVITTHLSGVYIFFQISFICDNLNGVSNAQ